MRSPSREIAAFRAYIRKDVMCVFDIDRARRREAHREGWHQGRFYEGLRGDTVLHKESIKNLYEKVMRCKSWEISCIIYR
jgi:hypothetical protein